MKRVRNTLIVGGVALSLLGGVVLPSDASAAVTKTTVKKSVFDAEKAREEIGRALVGMDVRLEKVEKDVFTIVDRVSVLKAVKGSTLDTNLRKLRVESGKIRTDVASNRAQISFLKVDAMRSKDEKSFNRIQFAVTSMNKQVSKSELDAVGLFNRVNALEKNVSEQNKAQLIKFDSTYSRAYELRNVRRMSYAELHESLRDTYTKNKLSAKRKASLLDAADREFSQVNNDLVKEGMTKMNGAYGKVFANDLKGAYSDFIAFQKTTRLELLKKYEGKLLNVQKKYVSKK